MYADSTTVSQLEAEEPQYKAHSTIDSKLEAEEPQYKPHSTTNSKVVLLQLHGDVHAEPSEANHSTTVSNSVENTTTVSQ